MFDRFYYFHAPSGMICFRCAVKQAISTDTFLLMDSDTTHKGDVRVRVCTLCGIDLRKGRKVRRRHA